MTTTLMFNEFEGTTQYAVRVPSHGFVIEKPPFAIQVTDLSSQATVFPDYESAFRLAKMTGNEYRRLGLASIAESVHVVQRERIVFETVGDWNPATPPPTEGETP